MNEQRSSRLTSEDRREQILTAASAVFGERGYAGGTTDAVARAAGISQAYVVRMFGSKEELFAAVGKRAGERVAAGFREAIAGFGGSETPLEKQAALGAAYADLVADRGMLLSLLHFFMQGHDATLGPIARACFLDIYRIVRDEAGLTPQETNDFFARGMLMNTLLAMHMPEFGGADPDAMELMSCNFGDKCFEITESARGFAPLATATRA